jgi:hypothetical protein
MGTSSTSGTLVPIHLVLPPLYHVVVDLVPPRYLAAFVLAGLGEFLV